MTRNELPDGAMRENLNIPPTFDVATHLRELGRVAIPAFLCAAVIAAGVYGVQSAQPSQYEAKVTATIGGGTGANTTEVTISTLAPPFVALSHSKPVLDDILAKSRVSMSADDLAKGLTVEVATSPSLVEVSARAETAADASALTRATVEALDDANINISIDKTLKDVADLKKAAEATADAISKLPDPSPDRDVLNGQYASQLDRARQLESTPPTRIRLLAQPANVQKVAPKPLQQALVALLVGWIVLTELFAFFNGRVGRRTGRAWVRREARRHGYPIVWNTGSETGWSVAAQVDLNKFQASDAKALVLYSSTSIAARSFVTAATEEPHATTEVVTRTTDSDWWRDADNVGRPLAIVVIDTASQDRKNLAASFDALDRYGIQTRLVVITPGRRDKHEVTKHAVATPG